jgi:hypothetical protein
VSYGKEPTKELRIVFTKSKKPFPIFSWAIRLWTRKPYSHVARAIQIRDWGYRFSHAAEGIVKQEFETAFYKKNEIVKEYVIALCEESDRRIKKEFYVEMGKAYGMLQNVGIMLMDIGLFKDNPWKDGRNCSELIYLEFLKVILQELDYNPDTIKPHHIENVILEYFYEKDGKWYLKD